MNFSEIRKLRNQGRKVVFSKGCFDLLHVGHVRFLSLAKKKNEILLVGVNSDAIIEQKKGKGRPIFSIKDRVTLLNSIKYVDLAFEINSRNIVEILKKLEVEIDFMVVPSEIGREAEMKAIIKDLNNFFPNIGIRRVSYMPRGSTTKIISKIKSI